MNVNQTTLKNNFTIGNYSHAHQFEKVSALFINTERLSSGKNRAE